MSLPSDLSARFALDVSSVEGLKRQARSDPNKALRSAASQFEALLMQMMLKSMREAADAAGTTDSNDTKLYKSMLDQQLSVALSKRGLGLADVMVRQLGRGMDAPAPSAEMPPAAQLQSMEEAADAADELPAAPLRIFRRPPASRTAEPRVQAPSAGTVPAPQAGAPSPNAAPAAAAAGVNDTARSFISRLWPHALEASRTTGVAPHFVLGQAALESGWGRAEIRMADGAASHNLFGIKAGRGWQGPTADVVTTEYVNGVPVKSVERFRAYSSYAEAFKDYANLLAANPRYAQVLNEKVDPAAFARGLQRAGYATDPNYADKLTRVITGSVMRSGLIG